MTIRRLFAAFNEKSEPKLLFPNKKFIVSKKAFARACRPYPCDRASFIPELINLLKQRNRLEIIINEKTSSDTLGDSYKFHYSDGHTPGMILTEIKTDNVPIIFAADLIPGTPWVHLPITMGYDRYSEKVIDEKRELLEYIVNNKGSIFFTHDSECHMSQVKLDEKGKFYSSSTI